MTSPARSPSRFAPRSNDRRDRRADRSDEANVAVRAVNTRLHYRPQPDEVVLRGSVAEAMMEG
jgi:hypothetical protein